MILSFKPQFRQKILDGTKIHTIRDDPNDRWQAGKIIHAATGVMTKNYDCFYPILNKKLIHWTDFRY